MKTSLLKACTIHSSLLVAADNHGRHRKIETKAPSVSRTPSRDLNEISMEAGESEYSCVVEVVSRISSEEVAYIDQKHDFLRRIRFECRSAVSVSQLRFQ